MQLCQCSFFLFLVSAVLFYWNTGSVCTRDGYWNAIQLLTQPTWQPCQLTASPQSDIKGGLRKGNGREKHQLFASIHFISFPFCQTGQILDTRNSSLCISSYTALFLQLVQKVLIKGYDFNKLVCVVSVLPNFLPILYKFSSSNTAFKYVTQF